jgi:hypothetical protein
VFRLILLAAAALVGGVTLGRSVVTKSVRGKVNKAVALAKARAEEELSREITAVVREKLAGFLLSTLWKILIVGAVYGLYKYGELTADGLKLAVILTTIGFACRDIYLVGPHLWRAYGYMRIHQWRPGEALREFIAGVVFDRAYEQALLATSQSGQRFVIMVSGLDQDALSHEIASAVSDVARAASVRLVRMRAAVGAAAALAISGVYAAFLILALSAL